MADRGLCTREEIPAEAKWAIEDLYKNDDEWEADFTRLKEHLSGRECADPPFHAKIM